MSAANTLVRRHIWLVTVVVSTRPAAEVNKWHTATWLSPRRRCQSWSATMADTDVRWVAPVRHHTPNVFNAHVHSGVFRTVPALRAHWTSLRCTQLKHEVGVQARHWTEAQILQAVCQMVAQPTAEGLPNIFPFLQITDDTQMSRWHKVANGRPSRRHQLRTASTTPSCCRHSTRLCAAVREPHERYDHNDSLR
jgi:hypothetical protein